MNFVHLQSDQLRVSLLDYGARLCGINFNGVDTVLNYPSATDYLDDPYYLGATVGPIANRLADARVTVHDQTFTLPANQGKNCLHSGELGVDRETWKLAEKTRERATFRLEFDLARLGMTGVLTLHATYQVSHSNLTITYTCCCTKDTYVNLTNHVYLNLSGAQQAHDSYNQRLLNDHDFQLMGRALLLNNDQSIPDGRRLTLTAPEPYRLRCDTALQGKFTRGVDNHVDVKDNDHELATMLLARSEKTGINLEVCSTSPGYQFYTGRFLGSPFQSNAGFCVETQYAPNAINEPQAYSPLLTANQPRTQSTHFIFSRSD